LVQRRLFSAEQASALPLSGRASRSAAAGPLGTLTRSIVPTGVAERAGFIPGPAAKPPISTTAPSNAARRRRLLPLVPRTRLMT
jgi:hypothetical protein